MIYFLCMEANKQHISPVSFYGTKDPTLRLQLEAKYIEKCEWRKGFNFVTKERKVFLLFDHAMGKCSLETDQRDSRHSCIITGQQGSGWVCSLLHRPWTKGGGAEERTQGAWFIISYKEDGTTESEIKRMFSINNLRRNAECVDDYPEMETLPEPF